MSRPLPKEIIRKARELILCGKSKQCVAKELGIGFSTVYKYTKDIPNARRDGQFSRELIQQIREEVLAGRSKYQIAKDRGLKFGAVYYYTQDLPNQVYREEGLVGKTLVLLKELLKEGYVVSTGENTHRLRRLKKYLPMIQRSQFGRGAVFIILVIKTRLLYSQ